MSLNEVARHLRLPVERVEEGVRAGEIPHERAGSRLLFRKIDVEAWASRHILGMEAGRLDDYHREGERTDEPALRRAPLVTGLLQPACCEPALRSRTRPGVLRDLVGMAERTGRLNDPEALMAGLVERERLCATALAGGVAMPHPATHDPYLFEDSFVVAARTIQPIPFGAPDGQTTDLFLLICCQDDRLHLQVLARLCMICHHTAALEKMRAAADGPGMYEALCQGETSVLNMR